MTIKERNRFILVRLFVILVVVRCSFGDASAIQSIPHDVDLVDTDPQPISLIIVDDSAYDKRNNVNKFKNLMINKDIPERLEDEGTRDEQIYYIPRVASGKKRDILTLTGNRLRFGNSNFRHISSFGFNNRPAP